MGSNEKNMPIKKFIHHKKILCMTKKSSLPNLVKSGGVQNRVTFGLSGISDCPINAHGTDKMSVWRNLPPDTFFSLFFTFRVLIKKHTHKKFYTR